MIAKYSAITALVVAIGMFGYGLASYLNARDQLKQEQFDRMLENASRGTRKIQAIAENRSTDSITYLDGPLPSESTLNQARILMLWSICPLVLAAAFGTAAQMQQKIARRPL